MLTAAQCAVVAYREKETGDMLSAAGVIARHGGNAKALADEGMRQHGPVEGIIQYHLDEILAEEVGNLLDMYCEEHGEHEWDHGPQDEPGFLGPYGVRFGDGFFLTEAQLDERAKESEYLHCCETGEALLRD